MLDHTHTHTRTHAHAHTHTHTHTHTHITAINTLSDMMAIIGASEHRVVLTFSIK